MSAHDSHNSSTTKGLLLVGGAALTWSFGGTIARFLHVGDSWTVVFWRSVFSSLFLLLFMLLRDGPRGTIALLKGIGPASVAGRDALGNAGKYRVLESGRPEERGTMTEGDAERVESDPELAWRVLGILNIHRLSAARQWGQTSCRTSRIAGNCRDIVASAGPTVPAGRPWHGGRSRAARPPHQSPAP